MKYYYLKRHKGIFKYFQHKHTYYGYRFTYYDGNHKRHEKSKRGFTQVINAIKYRDNISSLKDNNSSKDLTVAVWCAHFINMIKPPIRKITTYNSYKGMLKHVTSNIGNYKLSTLTLDEYQNKVINHLLKQSLSRSTVVEINSRFQTVINYAVKTRYLKLNPVKFATIPNVNIKPKHEIMSNHQLKIFNHNLKHHSLLCRVIFMTLEDTGLRVGELLGLHYKDLNLDKGIISVNYTRDDYGLRNPKTPHSKRKLVIPKSLNQLLSKYAIYCSKHYEINNHSLVIQNKHNRPLTPKIIPLELKNLLIECGLNKLVGRFVPHSFRHMFASRLINQGISIITVSKMLGHANPDITLKIYANAVPNKIPDISKIIK